MILWIIGWEGTLPQFWKYIDYLWTYMHLLFWICWVVPFEKFCLPWTLRTMSNLGLGVHLHNTTLLTLLGFTNLSLIFQILAIMPYLSILCLLRLCFTWSSEELCIFAIVWFRLTPCHLGCHWTKCINLFLIMLGWIINFA